MLEKSPLAPKCLDQDNPRFRDIHHACDSTYRELHQQGLSKSGYKDTYTQILLNVATVCIHTDTLYLRPKKCVPCNEQEP